MSWGEGRSSIKLEKNFEPRVYRCGSSDSYENLVSTLENKLAIAIEALELWENDVFTFYEMQPKIKEALEKLRL